MNGQELIANAFNLSDLVARELETMTADQQELGLTILNDILSEKSATGEMLPYYQRTSVPGIVGQEQYFLQDMVDVSSVTVLYSDVRFQMRNKSRRAYFGSSRVENINSFPYEYYYERATQSGNFGIMLFCYFTPSTTEYSFEVNGKSSLGSVLATTDMSAMLEGYYLSYLTYSLAKRLCDYYNQPFADQKMAQLIKLERLATSSTSIDPSISKVNQFGGNNVINYGDVNIGRGWRP